MNPGECQFPSLSGIAEGNAQLPPLPFIKRLILFVNRHLNSQQQRMLHGKVNALIDCCLRLRGKNSPSAKPVSGAQGEPLRAGDWVRVRSKEEIQATLDHLSKLKGCEFLHGMEPYCGTVQRVLKPVERFVDERDLRVKKCKGLVLLEGAMCQGVTTFGRCDRSCFFFWREEWLEKVKQPESAKQ